MANSFEQAFEQLSDEQLRQASEEHVRWRKTALLDDSIPRSVHRPFCELTKVDLPIDAVCEPFLFVETPNPNPNMKPNSKVAQCTFIQTYRPVAVLQRADCFQCTYIRGFVCSVYGFTLSIARRSSGSLMNASVRTVYTR